MEPDFTTAPQPKTAEELAADMRAAALLNEAAVAHNNGDLTRAQSLCRQVLEINAAHPDALQMLGAIALRNGHFEEAAAALARAVAIYPLDAASHYHHGRALTAHGRHSEALVAYDMCVRLQPGSASVHTYRGHTLWLLKQPQAAVESYGESLRIKPGQAEVHNNRGVALGALARHDEAIADYNSAIALKPDYAEAFNNRGLSRATLGQNEEAFADYDKAIALKRTYFEAFNNRGNLLTAVGHHSAAITSYDFAIKFKPDYAEAYGNRGRARRLLKFYAAALADDDAALKLNPDYPFLHGTRLHLKMMLCDWKSLDELIADLNDRVARGERATAPFPFLAITGEPNLQCKAAEIWTRAEHAVAAPRIEFQPLTGPRKIRIGYFSPDFKDHPVSILTAGLFEAHDRESFEIYAFSYGSDTQDAMRKRLERAFDRFVDVRDRGDSEIAALARSMGIDIAVDLAGYTNDSRTGIFAQRPAPIQATYIGYPGSMGTDFIDYIVADSTLIPAEDRALYAEKIAYLPNFQANDGSREIAKKEFTRAELGLPETGFVFCCFNNTFKILPHIFESWMNVLKRVPGSVLFLYADTKEATANLKSEAIARGVDADRLIFGKRVAMPEYLARFRAADLFLDTLPFNAGTTASDALWAGLPILTRTGESFAGRMAASLLKTLGLPELITTTQSAYEDLAVALAGDPARLTAIRQKVDRQKLASPLFNAAVFAGHIEESYRQMFARHHAGLAPDHIYVEA